MIRILLRCINLLLLLYLMAPIIVVVATSFGSSAYPLFPPNDLTLAWFRKFWENPELREALRLSATLSATSTFLATIIGTLSSLAIVRYRVPGKSYFSVILLSPILFPAIVLALALLVAFQRVGLTQSFKGLVAAHTLLITPFVIRLVMASLEDFDPSLEEAAQNLGAGWWRTFTRITLPLIRPGILAGAVFAFIMSFDELVVTLMLAGPELQTLPIRIFNYVQYSSDPTISAISTCLIAVWLVIGIPVYAKFLSVRHS
ncbi:MAG TPA: ABC transporter permease [Candidatus Acidoferrum sp.]|nr:ABC transporter permease [Candidatus Acidoferrum sp.]